MVFARKNAGGFGVVFDGIALQWDVDEVVSGGEEKARLRVKSEMGNTTLRRRRMERRERRRKPVRKGRECMTTRTRREKREVSTIMLWVKSEKGMCLVITRSWWCLGEGFSEA